MVSFIIPAHNEECLIARTIDALHTAAGAVGGSYEIIVADDGSTDGTGLVAADHGARVVRIERRQIAAARNAGARATVCSTGGDVLIFVDADTIVPQAALQAALNELAVGTVAGGASVRFDGPVPFWAEVMLRMFLVAFRVLRLAGGCFLFCTRNAFEAAGGWDESVFASEEVLMSQALKRHGRFVVLRESVITSGRKLRSYSAREIVGTLVRIGLSGRRAVRDRKALDLWYGPRRADPAAAVMHP